MSINIFNVIGKTNNQTGSNADQEIQTLGSTNLVSCIIELGFLGLHRIPMTDSIFL